IFELSGVDADDIDRLLQGGLWKTDMFAALQSCDLYGNTLITESDDGIGSNGMVRTISVDLNNDFIAAFNAAQSGSGDTRIALGGALNSLNPAGPFQYAFGLSFLGGTQELQVSYVPGPNAVWGGAALFAS